MEDEFFGKEEGIERVRVLDGLLNIEIVKLCWSDRRIGMRRNGLGV